MHCTPFHLSGSFPPLWPQRPLILLFWAELRRRGHQLTPPGGEGSQEIVSLHFSFHFPESLSAEGKEPIGPGDLDGPHPVTSRLCDLGHVHTCSLPAQTFRILNIAPKEQRWESHRHWARTYLSRGASGFWEDSVLESIGFDLRILLFGEFCLAPEGINAKD